MSARKIIGVILAAGSSARFGGDKLLAPYQGQPLLSYSAQLLHALPLPKKLIVLPEGGEDRTAIAQNFGLTCLYNPDPARGMGTSTALAAQYAIEQGCEALLILLGDMPLIPIAHVQKLLDLSENQDWVFTRSAGKVLPPAMICGSALHTLTRLSGDRGAKSVAPVQDCAYADLPPELARDMDRPEDFLS